MRYLLWLFLIKKIKNVDFARSNFLKFLYQKMLLIKELHMVARIYFMASCAIFFSLPSLMYAHAKPDWTFAVYMEAGTPDMHYWIHKNMNDMALSKADHKKVNIVTQVHLEKDQAWRYLIRKDAIKPVENSIVSGDGGQNIVDFMKWTVKKYPAHHYGLILWGHGFGILDPSYRPTITDPFAFDVEPDEPGLECHGGVCPLKTVDLFMDDHQQHRIHHDALPIHDVRGFMFNDVQAFINNAMMVSMLKVIKETVLKGKKLEILGTDCCKMAMLEVGYQAKDFVDYLVGSQNCELKDGWNYKDFLGFFNGETKNTVDVVKEIVRSYGIYYEKYTIQNTYSLSAIDLNKFDQLMTNLNDIIVVGKKLLDENKTAFKAAVIRAREICPRMCQASFYLDQWSLYANLQEELGKPECAVLNADTVTVLKQLLAQGQLLIEAAVIANTIGTAVSDLHGISLYFPRNRIDESYLATPFAQETAWLSFLQEMVG